MWSYSRTVNATNLHKYFASLVDQFDNNLDSIILRALAKTERTAGNVSHGTEPSNETGGIFESRCQRHCQKPRVQHEGHQKV